MKLVSQIVVVAVLAAAGAGAWYYRDQLPLIGKMAAPSRPGPGGPGGPGGQTEIPVETARARVTELSATVEAVGTTRANEAVTITAKTAGLVKSVRFQEAQKVAAGALLIELDADETRAKIQELEAARDNARQTLARAKALLASKNVPEARVDELQALLNVAEARVRAEQAKLADMSIRAPFTGRLGLRQVSPGALIKPGDAITTLDDTSVIRLDFEVPEAALAALAPGLTVTAASPAYPARKFAGKVATIDSRVDPVNRSIKVRAELPNPDDMLKPGMFMSVQLVVGRRPNAIVVPEESLLSSGERHFVFVVRDGRAVRTQVKIGQRLAGVIEIVEGIGPGTDVIVAGLQQVRDGAAVRPAPRSGGEMSGAGVKPAS